MDLVISASPKQPPLSVFAIQHLLCARKNPHSIAVFVHSSLKAQVPPRLAKGFQQVQQGNNKPVPVTITLVWKEGLFNNNDINKFNNNNNDNNDNNNNDHQDRAPSKGSSPWYSLPSKKGT